MEDQAGGTNCCPGVQQCVSGIEENDISGYGVPVSYRRNYVQGCEVRDQVADSQSEVMGNAAGHLGESSKIFAETAHSEYCKSQNGGFDRRRKRREQKRDGGYHHELQKNEIDGDQDGCVAALESVHQVQ